MRLGRAFTFGLFFSSISCSHDIPNDPANTGNAPAPVTSAEPFSSPMILTLHVTGGLPALDTTYSIERNGIIRIDEKMGWGNDGDGGNNSWRDLAKDGKSKRAGSVPIVDLAKLYEDVNALILEAPKPNPPNGDDFVDYAISIDGGRRNYSTHGLPLAGTAFRDVIEETRRLAAAMTTPKLAPIDAGANATDAGAKKAKKP